MTTHLPPLGVHQAHRTNGNGGRTLALIPLRLCRRGLPGTTGAMADNTKMPRTRTRMRTCPRRFRRCQSSTVPRRCRSSASPSVHPDRPPPPQAPTLAATGRASRPVSGVCRLLRALQAAIGARARGAGMRVVFEACQRPPQVCPVGALGEMWSEGDRKPTSKVS